MNRRSPVRLTHRVVLLGTFIAIFVALNVAMTTAAAPEIDAAADLQERRTRSEALLPQAREAVTFEVRLPTWLPAGYTLEHIAWFSPDMELGHTASSVDLWYSAPGKPRIHIWQTDIPPEELSTKDPTRLGGLSRVVAGSSWNEARGLQGLDTNDLTVLSTRLPDSITLSIDGGLSSDDIVKVAEGMVTAK